MSSNAITILQPGVLTTVQDLGRGGYGNMGVSSSGAFDLESATAANRMVVNDESAAVLECMAGGLEFQLAEGSIVAFAGAQGPVTIEHNGKTFKTAMNSRIVVGAGAIVRIGMFDTGLRGYVAVRGGIDVEPVLGSRSTDTLGKLGPDIVRAGQVLGVGEPKVTAGSSIAIYPAPHWSSEQAKLDVIPGPRTDWFADDSVHAFFNQSWVVTQETNRVGMRLEGGATEKVRDCRAAERRHGARCDSGADLGTTNYLWARSPRYRWVSGHWRADAPGVVASGTARAGRDGDIPACASALMPPPKCAHVHR